MADTRRQYASGTKRTETGGYKGIRKLHVRGGERARRYRDDGRS